MASRKLRLFRRILFMLLSTIIVYGGVIGVHDFMMGKFLSVLASMKPPPVSVSLTVARAQVWPQTIEAVASLQAKQGTELSPQVAGIITGLSFHSGQPVNKGQLLVQINDNIAKAQLVADKARQSNTRQQLTRQQRLYRRNATSLSNLQNAEAAHQEARAAVMADQAALNNLQIRAPFSGRLGIRQVSVGQYIAPGMAIVDLQQWNPLLASFQVPQYAVSRLTLNDPATLEISGLPGHRFMGHINAFGVAISTATRTITIQALFTNPRGILRPGMFGSVSIQLKQTLKAIAIPAIALTYNTYGTSVYVIKKTPEGLIAEQRIVNTGLRRGNLVDIVRGLQPGEQVVAAGQVKLYPGAHVKPVPAPVGLIPSAFLPGGP